MVITGATRGIGLATARGLAGLGADLVLVGRDPQRTAQAATSVRDQGGGGEVSHRVADLSRLGEVRHLAAGLLDDDLPIHVLLNNAGATFSGRQVTEDGIEQTFALNHVSPFLLTTSLLPKLRDCVPARVITVASDAHSLAHFNERRVRRGGGFLAYCHSKLCNILFTRELALRISADGIDANCLMPGLVRSGFGHNDGLLMRTLVTLGSPFMISAEMGARTSIHAAASTDLQGVTGQYFRNLGVVQPSRAARDDDAALRLWGISEEIVRAS